MCFFFVLFLNEYCKKCFAASLLLVRIKEFLNTSSNDRIMEEIRVGLKKFHSIWFATLPKIMGIYGMLVSLLGYIQKGETMS